MAKVLTPQKATSNADQGKKQRKKQAKREAKMMLKLEQAKQNVQKAEKKLAKTQAQLEAERTNLRDVEADLIKLRQPQETPAEAAAGDTAQVNEEDNIHEFMPSHEIFSLPPVEGRMDISEGSETVTPAQEAPGDGSPSAVETDETQQESTESPSAEEHSEETSGSRSTHRTSRSRRRSQPGHEEATTHTDETDTEAGS